MFKRRYIISIIITAVLLCLLSKIWLSFPVKSAVDIDFYVFFIILICGFLIALKLTDFLADFKELQNKSRIEIVFLAIFFVLLFIPFSHINPNAKSVSENRILAEYKPLYKNNKINFNYGRDFDTWFNDRFNARMVLYRLYWTAKLCLQHRVIETDNGFYDKKTQYAFAKEHIFYPKDLYTQEYKDKTVKNLDKLNDFCIDNGIKLYVFLAPINSEIYSDKMFSGAITKIENKKRMILEDIIRRSKANIIYPVDELKEASKIYFTHYKNDVHWNDFGAYVGYRLITEQIKKDYPKVRILEENEFNIYKSKRIRGNQFKRAHADGIFLSHYMPFLRPYKKKVLSTNYRFYNHKDKENIQADIQKEQNSVNYHYEKAPKMRVVLLGTSFTNPLTEFIPFTFRDVKFIRMNIGSYIPYNEYDKILKWHKTKILDYKPDIIIFCLTPKNLYHSDEWFKE